MRIRTKPISINECWTWRRFKTPKYKQYEEEVMLLIRDTSLVDVKEWQPLKVSIVFWLSSKNADIDNPIKPILDIFQKVYGFNDKQVYKLEVSKLDVKKWYEFIEFDIVGIEG